MSPRVALVLAGTLVYLAIAILIRGGPTAFFSHPPLTVLAIATVAMSVVAVFSQGSLSVGVKEDRTNRWVFIGFGLIGLLHAYLPPYTDRAEIWTLEGESVRWAGVILAIVGGALRLWPVFILGRRFSGLVAIQPGHELVTTGIYGIIRHPSYLGLLITMLGWALAFRSAIGVLLTLAILWPLLGRIYAEEAFLRAHFGEQYETYCRRTSRLIPGVY
jgi:protein-S-isoprenylcysteine O-methyltransferase Ste14